MGTTLESIHIPGGDVEQIRSLMPKAAVGVWSERFVSVFPENHDEIGGKLARRLSKQVPQPVLDASIFDSDAVEFAVYQDGKRITQHLFSPEFENKMGNIPRFCELLGLGREDAGRLRTVWSKADAQMQMELTAMLLGAPLEYCREVLPECHVCREIQKVDQWIGEISKPLTIKNATTAELIQQIEQFRQTINGFDMVRSPMYYMSEEPWSMEWAHTKTVWWKIQPDGTLAVAGGTEERLDYREDHGRLIGVADGEGVAYDSEGKLPKDFAAMPWFYILENGRVLIPYGNRSDRLLTCCDAGGYRLWTHYRDANYLGCGDEKLLLYECAEGEYGVVSTVKCLDAQTGKTLGRLTLETHVVYYYGCRDGIWWIGYSQDTDSGFRHWLLKLDENCNLLGKVEAADYLQEADFSPDGEMAYLFFYQSKVLVVNTTTLAVGNEIRDKALRIPCGTDSSGRIWMRRANSTLEAWSKDLRTALARHKLKGEIIGVHFDGGGNLCAAAWDKKKAILRIYRMA